MEYADKQVSAPGPDRDSEQTKVNGHGTEFLPGTEGEAPAFDLTKKKKKKKKAAAEEGKDAVPGKSSFAGLDEEQDGDVSLNDAYALDGDAVIAEVANEFSLLDFGGGKKKKKKKKVFFEDGLDEETDSTAIRENGERSSRREVAPQPWDGTDREYTYQELLSRALQFLHGKNPSLPGGGATGRKKISLQLPQVAREGTKKTVFMNFGAIAKSIHRQQDHLLAYMGAELGTSGNIQDGGRLVIKGRFTADGIANVLKRYMMDYVICQSCRSPDTVLMRDANTRLYFVSCESCGAHRSVANISAGYVARVTRRKKVG